MKKRSKDLNYDYSKQKEPSRPMGHGSYANMPEKPIMRPFPMAKGYRDGILNDVTHDLDEISGIDENHC